MKSYFPRKTLLYVILPLIVFAFIQLLPKNNTDSVTLSPLQTIYPNNYEVYELKNSKNAKIGAYITHSDTDSFRMKYITKFSEPDLFYSSSSKADQFIDFKHIRRTLSETGMYPVFIAAGAFTPDHVNIQGLSFADGVSVGQFSSTTDKGLNGLVLIDKNGTVRLSSLAEQYDIEHIIANTKQEQGSLFQQTSYIRPDGSFTSSIGAKYELRFLIQGTYKNVPTVGIIDFSIPMTYTDAVATLKNITDISIERAVGLDTGFMSEAYLYDANDNATRFYDEGLDAFIPNNRAILRGKENAASDEILEKYRKYFTNVIVVY